MSGSNNPSPKKNYKGGSFAIRRLLAASEEKRSLALKKVENRTFETLIHCPERTKEVARPRTCLPTLAAVMELFDMAQNDKARQKRYQAYASYSLIAWKAGISRRTAIRHVNTLIELGFLKTKHRKKRKWDLWNDVNLIRPGKKILSLLAKFTAPRTSKDGKFGSKGGGVKSDTDVQLEITDTQYNRGSRPKIRSTDPRERRSKTFDEDCFDPVFDS